MKKRTSLWSALLVVLLFACRTTAVAGDRVLLLVDAETLGTDNLVKSFVSYGHDVVQFYPEYEWIGDPPLAGFDVVVHLNGASFWDQLSVDAQHALVEFVRSGGGYVSGQFNGFEMAEGYQVDMPDLVLQLWPHPDNCNECYMIWTVVPGHEDHPVREGIPDSWTFFADAHDAGPLVEFETDPSTVLMTSPNDGPALIVREFECGRVVSFSFATNTSTDLTLQDPLVQQLYLNAISWSGGAQCVPATIDGLLKAVRDLVAARKIPWWQGWLLGARLRVAEFLLDRGHTEIAINVLWSFIYQVERMIDRGELSDEDGGPLADGARRLIENLSETGAASPARVLN